MSTPLDRQKQHEKLQFQADKLRANNSFKEAIGTYLNSIMFNRSNAETYLGLGICYKNLGKITKAIEYLEKAAILDNDKYETFYELGLCHILQEKPCCAIKCFIQAIQIEPDNPDAIYQLGIAHELAEEQDMALMIYQKLIENSPKYIHAYLRKSKLYIKMELYKQALGLYIDAAKINPDNTTIYSDIGHCLDKLGKHTDAKRYYRKFLSAQPDAENANDILKRVERLRQIRKSDSKLALVQ